MHSYHSCPPVQAPTPYPHSPHHKFYNTISVIPLTCQLGRQFPTARFRAVWVTLEPLRLSVLSTQRCVPLSPGVSRLSLLQHCQQGYKDAVPAQKKMVFLFKLRLSQWSVFPLSTTPCLCLTHMRCRGDTSDWSTGPLALGHSPDQLWLPGVT